MFVEFVLPEGFGGAGVGEPVGVHVGEEVVLAGGLEDVCDVGVLRGVGAELVVGAVAEVGPGCRGVSRCCGL